jgi:lysophospholipase L1-like esterase
LGPVQLAVAVFGAALAIAGWTGMRSPRVRRCLRALGRGLGTGSRIVAWSVGGVVSSLLIVELAAMVLAGETAIPFGDDEGWKRVPYYASQDWSQAYWDEFFRIETRYEPFLLWRSAPFSGSWIEVDDDGVRRTPGAVAAPDALRVLAFGGSAMWGTGAPDHATIPACLQRRLASAVARPVEVVNLAERGYVSTQGLLRLILELRAGRVPDLAIFYDGFNDVAVGATGDFGGHYQRQRVAGRLERPLRTWLASSRTATGFQALTRRRPGSDPRDAREMSRLTDGIVGAYLQNRRMVEALSRQVGFSYAFFWQPALELGSKPLAPGEEAIRTGARAELSELLRQVHGRIAEAAAAHPDLYDLAGVFDHQGSHLYVDAVHVTPTGNELVAAAMLEVLAPRLQQPLDEPR